MSPRKWKFVILGAAFCLLLVSGLVWALSRLGAEQPDFLRNMPEPNGYDLYVKAAEALVGEPEAATNNFSAFIEENEEALRLWREALQLKTEAPVSYYSQNPPFHHLGKLKSLGRAARALGEQAEKQNQLKEAVEVYFGIIRMGQAMEHGLAMNMLVGIALEDMGMRSLVSISRKLEPEQRRELARELEALNKTRIPFEEVMRREEYWAVKTVIDHLIYKWNPTLRKSRATMRAKHAKIAQAIVNAANKIRVEE